MSGTDVFGDISDLATALGVLAGGEINTAFFADPAATIGGTLRDGTRRAALLQFLDDVLGDSAPQVQEPAATWTPVFQLSDNVHLYLVTAQVADGITVGIGVRGATSGTPGADGRLSVPLALIPPSGPAVFLPGSGSADAVAQIAAQVDVGSASLQSVGLTAAIPIGPHAAGAFAVSVTGLRVPGSDTPLDLSLDSSVPIGPQLLHVVATLAETELQALADNIGSEAAALLGLAGLAPDSVIPLPLGDLATRGLAALRDWLAQVAASQAALTAWFAHLAALAGATVTGPLAAALTLTSGVDLTIGLLVDADDTGLPRFAPTVGLSATAGQGAIELTATVLRASIGSHPSVAATGATLDALSGTLADLHPQLLGLTWADSNRSHRDADGTPILPTPAAAPVLIRAGAAWFTRLRVVDAFGRFIDLPPSSVTPSAAFRPLPPADPAPAPAAQLLLRPRLTRPGRMLLDFVDASAPDGTDPAAAMVNQSDAAGTVSPVCGWLLPDHLDGALEVYDAAAGQLGMLLEDINSAVVWEGAPGRPGPAGAPPSALQPTDTAARHVVRMAAALVAADAERRAGPGAAAAQESALSALLRVIDTTAWTIDPFGSLGTEHHSVLVGRPIAVMRMQLQIQVENDLGTGAEAELNLDADAMAARRAAYDLLSARQITVRLGELTRTDDGVLGYFVDDDYSRFTPVSPEVLAQARASGRLSGQLGALGPEMTGPPAVVPITHPYVDGSETPLQARPGQTVRLTVLMAPGGSAHATCGLFPRVRTSLSREWIASALKLLMPTFRVGPLLVDPAAVRVPKTTGLPKDQVFTARPDPASWRDDPITAATQDALLPTSPAIVREGYLRVALPDNSAAGSS